jgi:lipopolysaccharide cholinephosphotransferase
MTPVRLSEADLQQLHRIQLEMLCELDRICRQLGVVYQLAAGTLLGAVRHGGFIPWDDDIDVVMTRWDYDRFLRQAPALLDKRLFLQTRSSDPGYPHLFAKLRRHYSVYRESYWRDHQQHHGIYIDIFPLDPAWPGSRLWRGLLPLLRLLEGLSHLAAHPPKARPAPRRSPGPWRLAPLLRRFLSMLPPSLWGVVHDRLLRWLAFVPSRQLVCLVSGGALADQRWRAMVRPIAEGMATVSLPFAGHSFPATAYYHQALTRLYGHYMELPPVDRRIPGHPVVEFRLPPQDRWPGQGSGPELR